MQHTKQAFELIMLDAVLVLCFLIASKVLQNSKLLQNQLSISLKAEPPKLIGGNKPISDLATETDQIFKY